MSKSKFQVLEFSSILPNPYRDLKTNPLREDKVQGLLESIKSTDYWENAMVRPSPTKARMFELVYGHHRFEAAKRSGITKAGFLIRDLDNAQMILRMDQENRAVYRNDLRSVIESVQAVVNALASGDIEAFKIDPSTRKEVICYAPSFVPGQRPSADSALRPFNTLTVAQALDRIKPSDGHAGDEVVAAFNALYLLEIKRWTTKDLMSVDRPGEYKSVMGMLADSRAVKQQLAQERELRQTAAERESERRSHSLKLDAERKAEAERIYKERLREAKRLADANREQDAKAAAERAAEVKEQALRNAARQKAFDEARKRLDDSVAQHKKIEEDLRKEASGVYRCKDEHLATRFAVKTYAERLSFMGDGGDVFVAQTRAIAKNQNLTLKERDYLWKLYGDMLSRYEHLRGILVSVPLKGKAELKDLHKKEKARRKREQ